MSTELNNYLLDTESQEWDDHVSQNRALTRGKAALLLGLLAGLGATAGATGKAEADELLLCTFLNPEVGLGTVVDDPESNQDQFTLQDPWDMENQLDSGVSQKIHKDYILKPISNGYQTTWRVFKRIDGQDVEKGILMNVAPINLMTPSGVFLTSGKTFHKVTDTGETLVAEEVGEHPGGMTTNFGGYVFSTKLEADQHVSLMALNEADILNHVGGGMVPIASLVELSSDSSNNYSTGLNVDESTNTLVISLKQGTIEIDLTPFLDENGKLSPDFSLTDAALGEFKPFPPKPGDPKGYTTLGTLASNGYRYHAIWGGEGIIMQTPSGQDIVIDKEQLNGGAGIKIYSLYELVHGGVYILFDNDFDSPSPVPPVVLHEDGSITVDPGDMTPFIKQCFVIPEESQDMFAPPVDPCDGVACEPPANPCKDAVCADGSCVEQSKPDGTTCDDGNICTTNDHCNSGQCEATYECPVYPCKEPTVDNPETGPCCSNKDKPDGTVCDDGNADTSDDQCVGGACEGTPIVNPETDTIETDPDVVENEPDANEPGPDVIEQDTDTIAPDATETDPDVIEQTPDGESDSQVETDSLEEVTNPDSGETDTVGEVDATKEDTSGDTNSEIKTDAQGDTVLDADTAGTDSIKTDTDQSDGTPGGGCGACDVSNAQRQQRSVKEMLLMFGMAALTILGARRKEKTGKPE